MRKEDRPCENLAQGGDGLLSAKKPQLLMLIALPICQRPRPPTTLVD